MEVEESTLERMRLLNESNTKFYRDVKAVCAKLTMSEKDVLGVYLYGSRLWGSATAKSDYDFLVVAKNALAKAEGSWTVHSGNCDFLLMTEKVFAQRLAQQTFLVTVIAHWLPPEWKWKQHTLPSPLPAIDKNKFVQAVLAEVERDWTVANKKRDKGMKDAANKVHAHAVRMLRIGLQVRLAETPSLCCTDDISQMAKEDYDGTILPAFLENEKETLMARIVQ